ASHFARAAGVLQLAERLRLDLADSLARHRELLPDFLQRVIGVHADAEAHAQNPLLAWGEARQDARHRLLEVGLDRRVNGNDRVFVLDEVTKVAVLLVPDRS